MTPFKLRGRQPEWIEAIERDLLTYSRLLVVAPGGVGKTSVMGVFAQRHWAKGKRTLILENRDRLTEQTAERVRAETGLEVGVEKADQHASPYDPVVVASVQSLSRINRLTGFAPDHFGAVIPDECHFCLAPGWLRIMYYFHYGAASLADDWVKPDDGKYTPLANLIGFTASPDLGDRRNLGAVFHKQSVNYSYLEAIEDGWLVGIKEINVPVKIDTRKFRTKKTAEGTDFNAADQSAALIPIIKELAQQIVTYGKDKKGICFLPSVECARLMAEALNSMGVPAIFVSGECLDKNEKTDVFQAAPRGTWLINCALYVFGVDFVDADAIAPFGAIMSKVRYIQEVFRGTRVLPGLVNDSMTPEQRRAAIASSPKPHLTLISPFFISDRIDICGPFDLFGVRPPATRKGTSTDFTDTKRIRHYIAALEKAANKHAHKQARTINPVTYALNVGEKALANYQPTNATEAAPATKDELDFLLSHDIDTTQVKTSGEAQILIGRLRERERLGLASPKALIQLTLRLGWPAEKAMLMKSKQAGVMIWKGIRYKEPAASGVG